MQYRVERMKEPFTGAVVQQSMTCLTLRFAPNFGELQERSEFGDTPERLAKILHFSGFVQNFGDQNLDDFAA